MKAIVINEFGGPEVLKLENVERPVLFKKEAGISPNQFKRQHLN